MEATHLPCHHVHSSCAGLDITCHSSNALQCCTLLLLHQRLLQWTFSADLGFCDLCGNWGFPFPQSHLKTDWAVKALHGLDGSEFIWVYHYQGIDFPVMSISVITQGRTQCFIGKPSYEINFLPPDIQYYTTCEMIYVVITFALTLNLCSIMLWGK